MSNAAILSCYRESPLEIDELVNGEVWSNIGGLYRLQVQAIVPGHELYYSFLWLKSVLAADSTLTGYAPGGIWRGLAPSGTVTPFIVIAFQAGTDVLTMNATRLFVNPLFQVKVTGPATLSPTLGAAAAEIDALLARTSGTI